jgi:predicted N-acetyltransferase YhbS
MTIRNACQEDNQALLELSRQAPMTADLVVSVDRSPDYFCLSNLQGKNPVILVAEKDGKFVGTVGFSFRTVLFREAPLEIAYIGGIKIDRDFQKSLIAFRLMKQVADFLDRSPVKCAVILVIGKNAAMNALLSGRAGIPVFDHIAQYQIKYLLPVRFYRLSEKYLIRPATRADLKELSVLFNQFYRNYELSPGWDEDYLSVRFQEPDFRLENSWLLVKDNRIAAAASLWDQSAFKNTIVTHYGGKYALLSRLIRPLNLLPARNNPLSEICLRYLVWTDQYPNAGRDLVRWLLKNQTRNYRFLRFGYHTQSVYSALLAQFWGFTISVNLYCAFRKGDPDRMEMIEHLRKSLIWEDLTLH